MLFLYLLKNQSLTPQKQKMKLITTIRDQRIRKRPCCKLVITISYIPMLHLLDGKLGAHVISNFKLLFYLFKAFN